MAVIVAGPAVNIVLAFVILWVLFYATSAHHEVTNRVRIAGVEQKMPATWRAGARATCCSPQLTASASRSKAKRRGYLTQIGGVLAAPASRSRAVMPRGKAVTIIVTLLRGGAQAGTSAVTPRYDAKAGHALIGFLLGESVLRGESVSCAAAGSSRQPECGT